MFYVEKTFKIPMGHRLSKHKGLCKNFHGHNFVIKVKVCSKELDKNDMVIDFSDLKRIVNEILEEFDHCMLLNTNDGMKEKFYDVVRTWEFQGDPTAEALCVYFFDRISLGLVQLCVRPGIKVVSVKIWENDDSVAEYIPE
jgi:6-pyruvoyltetrahydropterin/6-carboxytetrahydropterin synthase